MLVSGLFCCFREALSTQGTSVLLKRFSSVFGSECPHCFSAPNTRTGFSLKDLPASYQTVEEITDTGEGFVPLCAKHNKEDLIDCDDGDSVTRLTYVR